LRDRADGRLLSLMSHAGLGVAALLAAAILSGCGGASVSASNYAKQAEKQASEALSSASQSSTLPQSPTSGATSGGLRCPRADRGADVGTATFTFGHANRVSFTQDACPVMQVMVGHPELSYRGPAGCRGQFFVGDGTTADPAGGLVDWFRYGAHDAYLIRFGNQVYHFAFAPRIVHGLLVFDHDFGNERIRVTVSCPPPRPSRWLLPPSA
jgi:hypothetical protein